MGALGLALLLSARTMAPAFGPGAVIQDDARQHVFWMARYRDPELFPNDLIADYFQSLAPPGYAALYWVLSRAIDPVLASKLLPPLIGLASALFTFLLVRRLHPGPEAPFLATVLLSWFAWQHDSLPSASPRAFLLPLLAAMLWALVSGRQLLAVAVVALSALFYPVAAALGVALLGVRLVRLSTWPPTLARERSAWLAMLAAALVLAVLLVPSQREAAPFGPVVSAAQARMMPEFYRNGRHAYFTDEPYRYWMESPRSGLDLTVRDGLSGFPLLLEYAALAALLPCLLLVRKQLANVQWPNRRAVILVQLLIASFVLFFLAHLLLFRLYFPNRYVQSSVPLVFAVSAGLGLAILAQAIANGWGPRWRAPIVAGLTLIVGLAVAVYPGHPVARFRSDPHPGITAYLQAQPKEIVVAGVPAETDYVPMFAHRRILANREHAIAVHTAYYEEIRRRTRDLIEAYYAESPNQIADFAQRYGVEVFLVNRAAFDRAGFVDAWRGLPRHGRWEPFSSAVQTRLQASQRFALLELAPRCGVLDDGAVVVVPTSCLLGSLVAGR